jgi:hypothetical protein
MLSKQKMAREIEFLKMSGATVPGLGRLDPAAMAYP